MDLQEPISEYMSAEPISIQQEAELSEALTLMTQHGFRHLPVLDGNTLVGLVSERDLTLIETLLPKEWETIAVAEAMTPNPYAVAPSTPVSEVARVMAEAKIGSAVVVDEAGAVKGIFTTNDALRTLAQACGLATDP